MESVDALTAPEQGEADATSAAEAVYWLRHPEIAAATVNTLTAILDKWESEPEWTGPSRARGRRMPGMMPDEVLAVWRLRQWAKDRAAMRSGQVTDNRRQVMARAPHREIDSRIVRVVDFERALSHLTEEHQSILLLTYREHRDQRQVSDATGVSVRALSYKPPAARRAVASVLDRLDLL